MVAEVAQQVEQRTRNAQVRGFESHLQLERQ